MGITILKMGRPWREVYAGRCRQCGCEFEAPAEEVHERTDFLRMTPMFGAVAGQEAPSGLSMGCPECPGRADLQSRIEAEGAPPVRERGWMSLRFKVQGLRLGERKIVYEV